MAGVFRLNDDVRHEAEGREIMRLCHVTPLRNLVHIATGDGLLSTAQLSASDRRVFNQQDLRRLDEYPDHISCSIEFPNVWYMRQRRRDTRGADRLFADWVCVCIGPDHLWRDDTLFCPRNAAADYGRLVAGGIEAFRSLYAEQSEGAGGRIFIRTADRSPACPTDEQAEVLVHRRIPIDDIQRIVVVDESQAKRTFIGLEQLDVPPDRFAYAVCEEFFDPDKLSALLRRGRRPIERPWDHRSLTRG
jgi:ssDNA thymidine ADP-ribosyltransferase, DarT